eukprot:TRINITY_DN24409_c0_g1_i1.p1 TRINITY_DN24409_c0_g1~~TRINITY_DN24409_c0_g1_i1.p1  ORF type:complete len:117 (-),score=25.31 TRINITY_DN24409_c0_g1_i1:3-353(-)
MSVPEENISCYKLQNGHYRTIGTPCSSIVVENNILVFKKPDGSPQVFHIHYGNYGVAEPGTAEDAGQGFYNLELRNEKSTMLGVVSQDGRKMILKGIEGPTIMGMDRLKKRTAALG